MIELLNAVNIKPIVYIDEFIGEVPVSQLITGPDLAAAAGINFGISMNPNEPWLEFKRNGRQTFIAKKPYRYRVSWNSLNLAGVVRGKIININGQQYRCRLVKGAEKDPSAWTTAMGQNDPVLLRTSEWIELLARVHTSHPDKWANYSDEDLGVGGTRNGRLSHNYELITSLPNANMGHGNAGIRQVNYVNQIEGDNAGFEHYGWRPLLERIN